MENLEDQLVAVTGATGYVGGRLVPALLEKGYRVRCLARAPKKLEQRPWINHPRLEVVASDLNNLELLSSQLEGCSSAFYLVHSMISAGEQYAKQDQILASHFAEACSQAGVGRILYLGGLGEVTDQLSEHLSSRRNVEKALQ